MKPELVDVVDHKDKVIRTIDRTSATSLDILRVACILITNTKNQVLLQLRSEKSPRYPLHWDCSAGGHVDSGEEYATCAQRELFEEIGIKTKLIFLGKEYIKLDDGRKHFTAFFNGDYDGTLDIDPREVARVAFFSKKQITEMVKKKEKFHPECLIALKKYFW